MRNPIFTKTTLDAVLSPFIFGMVGALLMGILGIFHPTPQIATVNVTGLVDSFVKETAHQPLSPEQLQANVSRFSDVLNHTLHTLAAKKHLVLLPREAVIGGANDMTADVQQMVKAGLKSG